MSMGKNNMAPPASRTVAEVGRVKWKLRHRYDSHDTEWHRSFPLGGPKAKDSYAAGGVDNLYWATYVPGIHAHTSAGVSLPT